MTRVKVIKKDDDLLRRWPGLYTSGWNPNPVERTRMYPYNHLPPRKALRLRIAAS